MPEDERQEEFDVPDICEAMIPGLLTDLYPNEEKGQRAD